MLSWYGQEFLGRAESSTLATDPGRIPVSTQHYAQIAQSPIHSDLSGVVCFQGQIVHSSTHLNSVSPTREESPPFRRSPAAQPFVYSSPGYKTHLLQRRCKIFWLVSLFLFANIRISENLRHFSFLYLISPPISGYQRRFPPKQRRASGQPATPRPHRGTRGSYKHVPALHPSQPRAPRIRAANGRRWPWRPCTLFTPASHQGALGLTTSGHSAINEVSGAGASAASCEGRGAVARGPQTR